MAVTLTDFAPYLLTNDATATEVTAVTFHGGTVRVRLLPVGSDAHFHSTGTDNTAQNAAAMRVPVGTVADVKLSPEVYGTPPTIYLSHGDNSGKTHLQPIFAVVYR